MNNLSAYDSELFSTYSKNYNEAHFIVPLLATRSYHIPGNNWYQDWTQFMINNHPLFSIFCHHRLHPLRLAQRVVCLIGSVSFGLITTNCVYLYYNYYNLNMDHILVRLHLGNVIELFPIDGGQTWNITHGMVTLWTFGGLLHSAFDITIWFLSSCSCCLPGGSYQKFGYCRKFGSYVVIIVVIILVAVTSFVVALRATLESKVDSFDINLDIQEIKWNQVYDARSFSFVVGYLIELPLALFLYYPLMATILFSGILGCGTLPILGGRPREIKVEFVNKLKEAKNFRKIDILSENLPTTKKITK